MDTFNFTKKKLLKCSSKNQHNHIIKWLSRIYQSISTNRMTESSLEWFGREYQKILSWAGLEPFNVPDTIEPRHWLEIISDRIHYHRHCIGISAKDSDLLKPVMRNDGFKNNDPVDFDCHIALDGLRSMFNIGSIIRSGEAAGFSSILLGNIPGSDHPSIKKTAMGAEQWIKSQVTADLAQTLLEKKKVGYSVIGVETIEDSLPYDRFNWTDKTILVFGNEEYGISSHLLGICDSFVHIPMYGYKNSINVANAASVIFFHLARYLVRKM